MLAELSFRLAGTWNSVWIAELKEPLFTAWASHWSPDWKNHFLRPERVTNRRLEQTTDPRLEWTTDPRSEWTADSRPEWTTDPRSEWTADPQLEQIVFLEKIDKFVIGLRLV